MEVNIGKYDILIKNAISSYDKETFVGNIEQDYNPRTSLVHMMNI